MLPFITVGPYRFATYGIMMVAGLCVGYYLLRADLHRRRLNVHPLVVVLSIGLAGLLGSKLYLGIENPAQLVTNPGFLLSRSGYTFYGAVLGGAGMIFVLAWYYRISSLRLFDAVSAEAAIGYGIGRLGCLLAGDGDYGTPTSLPWGMRFPHGLVPTLVPVHPTPIYEFFGSAFIATYLWRLGARRLNDARAAGEVFARYLLLSGSARFLVEFIRLNPRVLWGLSNAQCVALLSIAGGIVLQTIVWWRHRAAADCSSAAEVIVRN
ncbi:MAG TPA: prolipoprotein diacylglyceryl transferase family protein [Solimonas sp.]|nr:prolipoprotein diacylglyceryl transferase family protein [Solimonas sp.]